MDSCRVSSSLRYGSTRAIVSSDLTQTAWKFHSTQIAASRNQWSKVDRGTARKRESETNKRSRSELESLCAPSRPRWPHLPAALESQKRLLNQYKRATSQGTRYSAIERDFQC